MNKRFLLVFIPATLLLIAGCSGGSKSDATAESARVADSIAAEAEQAKADSIEAARLRADSIARADSLEKVREADEKLISDLYYRSVFGYDNSFARKVCSKEMIRKLIAANEYDGQNEPAMWYLRAGVQDGDGPSKIKSIEAKGDGWYKVTFTDLGTPGSKQIRVTDGVISDYR